MVGLLSGDYCIIIGAIIILYNVFLGAGTSNSLPRQTIVYKHAVKQMKVSRTVLIYVIVFAICWIPQRIVHFVYVTEVSDEYVFHA